jgi:4-alpha-glucanotransferase
MRDTGLLLAVSSLPSMHGIGDFGKQAFRFLDDCNDTGIKIWQILPLNPLGYGNSPYQPYSSKAMDELYISLDGLREQGLISKPKKFNENSEKVDYEAVRKFKNKYLSEAFENFEEDQEYLEFIKQEWLYNYAVFICFKNENNFKQWNLWSKEQISWIADHKLDLTKYESEIKFEMFKQFILFKQWMIIKKYANSLDIQIMGDIPFYVGFDSLDVYSNTDAFVLDDQYNPKFVAGVPPDYFAKTGQRWGNPIYDWEYLKKNNFDFWIDRISYNDQLFDIIRIDHFRAFDTYWKIDANCPTAIEGEWVKAPGYEFFDALFEKHPNIKLVAEDLGELTKGVSELRDHYNFKGMKIIQFIFDPRETNNDGDTSVNSIIYTGTHDNSTIKGWYNTLNNHTRKAVMKSLKKNNYDYDNLVDMFIEFELASVADCAILPMQDVLQLDDSARMNVPGTIGSPNWTWKMSNFRLFESRLHLIKRLIKKYNR